jgi:hypothetical protein
MQQQKSFSDRAEQAGLPATHHKLRLAAVVGGLCAVVSIITFFGNWHEVKDKRIIGSPAGDCAGKPCMAVVEDHRTCTGRAHFRGIPWPLLPGVLGVPAQLVIVWSLRRQAILALAIPVSAVSAVGLLFPIFATVDHLFSKTTVRPASVLYMLSLLGLLGAAVMQILLARRPKLPFTPAA